MDIENPYVEIKDIDPKVLQYYEQRYDVLHFSLLNQIDFEFLGNKEQRICRFCRKSEPDVTFEKIAHVIPESTGNQFLASYYECDVCNKKFGRQLEAEFANFSQFYHNAMNIHGKKKVPEYQSKNGKSKAAWKKVDGQEKIFMMRDSTDNIRTTIDLEKKTLRRTGTVPAYVPIAVFKCFVKMAISLMPENEVENFKDTIDWILNKKHSNFYTADKKLLVRYRMIPGFNVTKYPACFLYRRKPQIWQGPYMLFSLTYGCFAYFIEVPTSKDGAFHHIMNIPFPILPFKTSSEGFFDLTSCDKKHDDIQSIEYQFDTALEVTGLMKDLTAADLF